MSDGSGSIATLGSIRGMPNLLDDVERMPERPSVPSLIALLRSTDETERDDALASLAELVDGAFGVDGAELGLAVRANGGIALLSWLLADPSAEVQQMALMILGNLCSDSVDSNSRATKALLLQSGGARALLSCVHTEDPAVLLFACGALQNLCFEPDWSELAVAHDIHIRLQGLLCHEDAMIVRYASGCLQNITRSLHIDGLSELAVEAVKERNLEHRQPDISAPAPEATTKTLVVVSALCASPLGELDIVASALASLGLDFKLVVTLPDRPAAVFSVTASEDILNYLLSDGIRVQGVVMGVSRAGACIACLVGGKGRVAPDVVARIVNDEEGIVLTPHPTDADTDMLFLAPDADKALQLVRRHRFQAGGGAGFTFTFAKTAPVWGLCEGGDLTSEIKRKVRDEARDEVRDEVRFEVAVALVYAKENPHIIGGGRPRAHGSNSTVQALWRHTAVQCGFSEQEKPDPLEIALNAELMIDYECFEPITPGRPPSLWELDDASEKESSTPSMGASSSSLGAMVGAPLMPASPPKPMQAELPVPPASLMPAMLVTAGTGHPWRIQQAQQAQQADAAVRDVADDLFFDGVWSDDTGSPLHNPISGVERSYCVKIEDELDDESSEDDETRGAL
ncbi:hypothetical protein Ctob_011389 [Chrysochromulina tobinii]|uniref:Uncharacterized protein n=1 Tax=Chrysochromulina tobinii TaxID=1460289 RepID=A0A0M0K9U7_9EUKA|nr:hypothetical protein Ctob_011389 [Chrysochromulina tobinii]|eukprot:KOO35377.1 hypothetical protein Ctob_011389 [Chrysochromulina sp. CCMP291]